jgi:hypothetical protein
MLAKKSVLRQSRKETSAKDRSSQLVGDVMPTAPTVRLIRRHGMVVTRFLDAYSRWGWSAEISALPVQFPEYFLAFHCENMVLRSQATNDNSRSA